MLLPGTYANGFAPRDGQPLYPSLWTGCVGAWNPGLGVSGLTLRDWSGFKNNGTLTGGPTWAANQGKYALDFDGVDDFIDCGAMPHVDGISRYTLSFFGRKQATLKTIPVGKRNGSAYCGIDVWNDGNVYFQIFPGYGLFALDDTNWHHYCMVFDGTLTGNANRLKGYVDGVQKTLTFAGSSIPSTTPAAGNFYIGQDAAGGAGRWGTGSVDDVFSFASSLNSAAVRTLATRRGIAYEMAPRRRSSVQVTTNRRRRIIIGGNR